MANEIKINVVSHVDEVLGAMDEAIQRALTATGLQMERNAKIEIQESVYDTPESPTYKRTGRLRASLTFATKSAKGTGDSELRGEPDEDKVYVGTNVEYAPYVEFGTSRMKAKPYLKPAVANHIDEYKKIIETELER